MAGAGLEPEVDVARRGQRAEVAAEPAGLEQRRGHGGLRLPRRRWQIASPMPRMPLRANRAITTSSSPRPSCQAVG